MYNPETKLESQRDLAELVRRDRNHPSVWVWNFCNEVNCNNDLVRVCLLALPLDSPFVDRRASPCVQATVQGMRNVTDLLDGTRPVTMNHLIANPAEAYLDM